MDHAIADLSAAALIGVGGWNPAYARVLLIEHDDQDAVVLVDGNGDGAELELEYWHRDGDIGAVGPDGERAVGWRGGATSGHGSLDTLPTQQGWNAGAFVAALGRVAPGQGVGVAYGGQVHRRAASALGVWGFLHRADSPEAGELPVVAELEPPA